MNRMITIISAIALSAAIYGFFSCTSGPAVTITDDDNGKSIAVPEGKLFAVRLKAQLGTGYGWQVKDINDYFSAQGAPKQEGPDKKETGGFEFQTFSFKAMKKGKSELLFQYRQPWNNKAKSLKEYRVTVEIQ